MRRMPVEITDSPTPSAPKLPVTVGRFEDFARDPVSSMRQLWARHGEVCALQEDALRVHFVFGPEYIRQVLTDEARFHSQFFAVRGPRKSAQRRVTSGLLTMNGEEHRQHRRLVMGPFQKKAIAGYHDTVVEVARESLADWRTGQVRDLNVDMTHYMLRLTSRIVFGVDEPELAYRIGELTHTWVQWNHRIGPAALSSNPALSAQYDNLLVAAEELEQAIKELIHKRRSGKLGFDVLSLLLRAHDSEAGVSDDQLIGHIAILFGAAHLTSAHTLAWTLFLLAQHPEVMGELHEELQTVLGGETPRPEQLDQLPVLDRVLKESMRVLPASAYSQRMAATEVDLGPFKLSPGSMVIFSQFITHHLPSLYEQPERFLPDRWKTISPSPYAYLPFGAGPRMCVGAGLGMMQLKISLPAIFNQFKLSLVDGAEVNGKVQSTMLYPIGRVPVLVQPQDGQFHAAAVSGNIHSLVDLPPATSSWSETKRRVA
jgi:cytochrome P450